MADLEDAVLNVHYINKSAFEHIDDYHNSFKHIECVKSEKMWGDDQLAENPFISVLIPTYMRGKRFEQTLKSVLNQNDPSCLWEILVIDNSSFDDDGDTPALKIIREINDSRVQYYHNEINIGSGYNWNRGVELARGKWICLVHDDDIIFEDALKNICFQINKHNNLKKTLGYIHANRDVYIENICTNKNRKIVPVQLTRFGTLMKYYTETGSPSCGTAILKEAYLCVGGIRKDFGPTADAILGYQIMKNYAVITSDHILGCKRRERNESSNKRTAEDLMLTDFLFSEYVRRQTLFGKIYADIFGNAQNSCSLQDKLSMTGLKSNEINVPNCICLETSKIKIKIYLLIRKVYSFFRLCKGWLLLR